MTEKMLHLQPRLQCLADLVPEHARLADVGTDHGYIPVYLLQRGRIDHAIAADIGAEPLDHARRTAREYELSEQIDFRLCDGLAGIRREEVDCILIAGMGGETIISILENAPWLGGGEQLLLLQPQSRQELLRSWLTEHGFAILKEQLVLDKGTIYNVMQVRAGGTRPLSEVELYGGVHLEEDPLYGDYLQWQIQKIQTAVKGLRLSKNGESQRRADELERLIVLLQTQKGAWENGNSSGN